MNTLVPEDLLQYLTPALTSMFGKFQVSNIVQEYEEDLKEFIENPSKTFLMAQKGDPFVLQTSFEYSKGPILICQKQPVELPNQNFQSLISIVSLTEENAISFFQNIVGNFFLPLLQSSASTNDNLAKGVIDSLSNFEIAASRFQHKSNLPEPILDISPELFDITSSDQLSITQESSILSAIDKWQTVVGSINNYAKSPPKFETLQNEINFWPQLSNHLQTIESQITKLLNSNLLDIIEKYRKSFPEYIQNLSEETSKYLTEIKPFSEAISQFNIDIYLECQTLMDFNDKLINVYNFLTSFFNRCPKVDKIVQIYTLFNDFSLFNFSKVLSKISFIHLSPQSFENTKELINIVNDQWNIKENEMIEIITKEHLQIKQKLQEISLNRSQYMNQILEFCNIKIDYNQLIHQIQSMDELNIETILVPLEQSFSLLLNFSYFEYSKESNKKWNSSLNEYKKNLEKIENEIGQKIYSILSNCKNISETRNIFVKYKSFVRRPTIQSCVHQFEHNFILQIYEQLEEFKKKEFVNIQKLPIMMYMQIKGLTSDSAKLLHYYHIIGQLKKYEEMLNDVIGEKWKDTNECQQLISKLKECNDSATKWCNLDKIISTISFSADDILNKNIFVIETINNKKNIKCNYSQFNLNAILTFRTLNQFNLIKSFDVIYNMSKINESFRSYVNIQESLTTFINIIESFDVITEKIAANEIQIIYNLIQNGYNLKWNSQEIQEYSQKFALTISEFNVTMKNAKEILDKINENIQKIENSQTFDELKEYLAITMTNVDQLFWSKMTNDEIFVNELNQRISKLLIRKINETCLLWIDILSNKIKPNFNINIKIIQSSNKIIINPSLENIHSLINRKFSSQINSYLLQNQICTLNSTKMPLYQEIIPIPYDYIYKIYQLINSLINEVRKYCEKWNNLEILFMNEPNSINFEDDIIQWLELYNELENELKDIQNSSTKKSISLITIDTINIQKNSIERLNIWKDYVINNIKFISNKIILNLFEEIQKSREILEMPIPFKAKELSSYLNSFKECSTKKVNWDIIIPSITNTQKIYKNENYIKLISSIDIFNQIYITRKNEIDKNNQIFCTQVEEECSTLLNLTLTIKKKWDIEKPLNGDINPDKALNILQDYKNKFNELQNSWNEILSAREALHLTILTNSTLEAMIDDCNSMIEVWNLLLVIWNKLNIILQQPFLTLIPIEFKTKIQQLIDKLQNMSNIVRQYESWSYFNQKLKNILLIYPTIENLKSPAILARHWQKVSTEFKMNINIDKMTVNDIISLDLIKNETFFAELLRNAQGEFSLYQYLEQLNQTWDTLEFEFYDYKGKQLIKGWDIILTTINDHLNFLTAMQTSPFYNVFREQAIIWETKLNQLQVLLDEWLDVQRHFIYLEGIFVSSDIKSILTKATTIFKKCEKDIITLIKRAINLKFVIKILTIPNINLILQNLNESLLLLQKDLSDYLEKQRSYFPRFFFIGDEDLLEIIGKSSAIQEIQRHFNKMFEGISGVIVENNQIIKMECNKGESILLKNPIQINSAIYQTLNDLENEMRNTLKQILLTSVKEFEQFWENMTLENLKQFIEKYPAQIILLSFFIISTNITELCITKNNINKIIEDIVKFIELLSQLVYTDLTNVLRFIVQQLITESVHQRNLLRELENITSTNSFEWTRFLRYYHNYSNGELIIKIGDAIFNYGFEYLGLIPSLVRTPLTDRVYLTMAQALYAKMGGSPFGPAGTGKTETVKNMGHHLGRHVLVFNCDETFDFKAMGRIFIGLCQCGSWGCFDEFNRLDEQMLSAVSQQIQTIQIGLKNNLKNIEILGKNTTLNQSIGIFITMNPGYAGRVELPDNLKQLFRTMAMNRPDLELITEVLLFSQGFIYAEKLSPKFVTLFSMAKESLSHQTHYDFGLRAMKSVLTNAGILIRQNNLENDENRFENESKLLISSIINTIYPKLIANDLIRLKRIINDIFPNIQPEIITQNELINLINEEISKSGLINSEIWINKIIQLYYIQQISHGFMLVGPTATGKTSARKILLKVLTKLDQQESEMYIINPKSVTKETLFGSLDPITREWTDGIFTRILRTIVNNQRNEMSKRHWIIFDGDVDPEWVENLNSVLDDNKLLTLPNGERISLPSNVRIVFEVENLNFATPATVSRCGIIFFSEKTLNIQQIIQYHLHKLITEPIITQNHILFNEYMDISIPDMLEIQTKLTEIIKPTINLCINECIKFWEKYANNTIMEIPIASCITTMFSLLSASYLNFFREKEPNQILLHKYAIFSMFNAFSLPFKNEFKEILSEMLSNKFIDIVPKNGTLNNYIISDEFEDWINLNEINYENNNENDYIITPYNELYKKLINMIMIGGNSIILCGQNGIGKRSLLQNSFVNYSEIQTIRINFSNFSTIDYVLSTFEQFCIYQKTSYVTKLKPKITNNFIIFECINLTLPSLDKFGTQRIIEFLRQILEFNGFWHPQKREWIQLENIIFESVCTPSTEYGRVKLNSRFLRHTTIFNIDTPTIKSIKQILLNILSKFDNINQEIITNVILEYYNEFIEHFKGNENVFYHINLRDIIIWINSYKYILNLSDGYDKPHLLYYEGLRVFNDRLINIDEKNWAKDTLKSIILKYFENTDLTLYDNDINYTNLINQEFLPYDIDTIKNKLQKDYSDENLVFFDECINLITKIENSLIQPNGHLYLIGLSGTGKSILTTFISKYLNMKVFKLNVTKDYTINNFDSDLRKILKTSLEEKVCFIIKENDIILPIFTERLNVLLTEYLIPGLFTGDELNSLLNNIKEIAHSNGQLLDNEESLINFYLERIKNNLHIIFTSNSAILNINQTEIMFPSLFNQCNIIWIGKWSNLSLKLFAEQILNKNELEITDNLINSMIKIHSLSIKTSESLPINNYVSPRYFFDFIKVYCYIFINKREKLNNEQQHLSNGLNKLEETQIEVTKMGKELALKQTQLKEKDKLAEQKLEEILKDKQVTTSKQEEAQKIKVIIDEKKKVIDKDKSKAMAELAEVTPIIEEAKSSVSNIKKSNLDEIRRLTQPPDVIKNVLQAVLQLLDINAPNWTSIRKVISGDQFIKTILEFKVENIPQSTIKKVQHLLDSTDLTYEKAQRASQACGPLFKWLSANIRYLSILESTEPLREKVKALESEASIFEKKHEELSKTINEFEEKLQKLTSEYKVLLSECEKTRKESEQIQVKLNRAKHLLSSLTNETKRWAERKITFQNEQQSLIGNSLLSSAFISYCGFLEQQKRMDSLNEWMIVLDQNNIKYSEDYQFCDFMIEPENLINWSAKQLPKDDLCIQNAIILTTENLRTPFIIDPAGQATQFIMNLYKGIIRTSFNDKKFPKTFESCVRFGTPILIEDGEQIDPLILPILSKEYKKVNGRIILELNHNEIDISPSFKMFIITRDTDFSPQPSLSSLTTIINFSVTSLSLYSQCLTRLLQFKLPDIEKRRKELHESLAEMQIDLRNLEEKMLNVFSTTKGEILENDELLYLLEDIKKESIRIEQKVNETNLTLQEITQVSEKYSPVAKVSTSLYFAIKDMSLIHFMYQFSLQFFWSIFDKIIIKADEVNELIELISKGLFINVSYSLLNKHISILGFRFSQIILDYKGIKIDEQLFDIAIRGTLINGNEPDFIKKVNNDITFNDWINSDTPEQNIPESILQILKSENENPSIILLKVLVIIRKFKPDRIISTINLFIKESFEFDINDIPPLNIINISNETQPNIPILLCSSIGYDPSELIENNSLRPIISLAIGSSDSYSSIEESVQLASQKGNWIIIKNIHLAPLWTRKFVKNIQNIQCNPQFRIFLTTEINPKVGSNIFRLCHIIVFESSTGIRSNLQRVITNGFQWPNIPKERSKLVINFLLLHSIIMERLRYEKLGWNKSYEFNDNDLLFTIQISLRWIEAIANGRSHINEEQIPWYAIRYLISYCIYGGRIDLNSDQRILINLSKLLFKGNIELGDNSLSLPDEINNINELQNWVSTLSYNESPEFLWLPKNSGKFLFMQKGNEILQQILTINIGSITKNNMESKRSNFIQMLFGQWLEKLNNNNVIINNENNINSLIHLIILDEINSINETRNIIINDINEIINTFNNNNILTQRYLNIINDLERSIIPKDWNQHNFNCNNLTTWINDFCLRINHLNDIINNKNDKICLGLLKSPESLINAAKQTAANINKWPIEKIRMKISTDLQKSKNESEITITELQTLNANWNKKCLIPSDDVTGNINELLITWTIDELNENENNVLVPWFMTKNKSRLVLEVEMPVDENKSKLWWTVRNPSIILQPKGI